MNTWCKTNEHDWIPRLVGYRKRNGLIVAARECRTCGYVRTELGVSMTQADAAQLLLRRDRTAEADRCTRCGSMEGTERHHWAPRAIFGDAAEGWPTDDLCRACHIEWHRRMGA